MPYVLTAAAYADIKNNARLAFIQKNGDIIPNAGDTKFSVGDVISLFVSSSSGYQLFDNGSDPHSSAYFKQGNNYLPFVISAVSGKPGIKGDVTYSEPTNGSWDELHIETRRAASNTPIYSVTQADIDKWRTNNSYLTINGMTVVTGTKFKETDLLEFTPSSLYNYIFDSSTSKSPVYLTTNKSGVDKNYYFDITNPLKAKLTVPLMDVGETVKSIKAVATIAPRAVYTVVQADLTQLTDNGVTMLVNGSNIALDMKLFVGDVLMATAESGREFYIDDVTKLSSAYLGIRESGAYKNQYFTITDRGSKSILTISALGTTGSVRGIVTVTRQATPAIVGTNNVYLVDEANINILNKERFKTVNALNDTVYDYGQFILSLIQVPFEIPANNILLPEPITLANYKVTAVGTVLNTDIITVDLGNIIIPESNSDLLDYVNTSALLYLPRIPPMNVDLEYVIGQTISVKYLLDCYTGKATVIVTSSKSNSPIITTQVDLGISIPFANYETAALSIKNSNIVVGGDNGVKSPYIEIIRNDSVLIDGFFTNPIIDEDLLSNQHGFIQVEQVELKTFANKSEKDMIYSLLTNGVIIK